MLQAASRQQCTGRWPIAALPLIGYPSPAAPRSSFMTPAAEAPRRAVVVVDDAAAGRCVAGADGRQGHGAAAQAGAAKEDFVVARVYT